MYYACLLRNNRWWLVVYFLFYCIIIKNIIMLYYIVKIHCGFKTFNRKRCENRGNVRTITNYEIESNSLHFFVIRLYNLSKYQVIIRFCFSNEIRFGQAVSPCVKKKIWVLEKNCNQSKTICLSSIGITWTWNEFRYFTPILATFARLRRRSMVNGPSLCQSTTLRIHRLIEY